jgi:hypothetical protein
VLVVAIPCLSTLYYWGYFHKLEQAMSQDNALIPEEPKPEAGIPYFPQHELLHEPIQEDILLNRWQLKDVLVGIENERTRPKFGDSFPWIGVLLAFLLALLSADFHDFMGLPGDVWTAIVVIGAAYSLFRMLQIWWEIWQRRNDKWKSAEERVQEIVEQFRSRRIQYMEQGLARLSTHPPPERASPRQAPGIQASPPEEAE